MALIGTSSVSTLSPTQNDPSNNSQKRLQHLHDTTFRSLTEQIKNVLANMQAFVASDVSFSAKVHFIEPFCKEYVREQLLIPYLKHIGHVAREYADGLHEPTPYPLILVLARLCLEFESVAIDYLVNKKISLNVLKELILFLIFYLF